MGFQDLATIERELSEYSGGESLVSKTMVGVEVALDHEPVDQKQKSWINMKNGLFNSHWTFRRRRKEH